MSEKNSRVVSVLLQGLFGYSGAGRIYSGSWILGTLQFLAFAFVVLLFARETLNANTFVIGCAVWMAVVLLWILDALSISHRFARGSPVPPFSDRHKWTDDPRDRKAAQGIGFVFLIGLPLVLIWWTMLG